MMLVVNFGSDLPVFNLKDIIFILFNLPFSSFLYNVGVGLWEIVNYRSDLPAFYLKAFICILFELNLSSFIYNVVWVVGKCSIFFCLLVIYLCICLWYIIYAGPVLKEDYVKLQKAFFTHWCCVILVTYICYVELSIIYF